MGSYKPRHPLDRPRRSGAASWSSSPGPGYSPANSNTRIHGPKPFALPDAAGHARPPVSVNLGLNSERLRAQMIRRLREQGIDDERVLAAMQAVPRHLFVDQGLASRAYEDAALPIGYGQTISQPWVVARMISVVSQNRDLGKVLEIGAGCGYQAAVLAQLAGEVHSIERVRGLYELARSHLRSLKLISRVRLSFGDGMKGLPGVAPFDAIVVAAAGMEIPQPLLDQLAPGGRLIAPQGAASMQRLILVERVGAASWHREELDAVRFVPLRAGTQP